MGWEVGEDLAAGQSGAVCRRLCLSRVGTAGGAPHSFCVWGVGGHEALIEVLGALA